MSKNKERADKLRLEILQLSNDELINVNMSVYSGEQIEGAPFESLVDYFKRVSCEFEKNMPF